MPVLSGANFELGIVGFGDFPAQGADVILLDALLAKSGTLR